jgi:hypothetical protein
MKIFKFMLMAVVAIAMASCSGGYNEKTCEELAEKIKNHDELTQADYSAMIEQLDGVTKEVEKLDEKYEDNPMELHNDEEAMSLIRYAFGFALTLEQANLDESNQKKYDDLKAKIEEAKEKEAK